MTKKELTVEEWHRLITRIQRIENELQIDTTVPRLKYGDITNLEYMNNIIDTQRGTIHQLQMNEEGLRQLIQQKITDVTERTGYLFTPEQTEAVLQVLNELKNELKT